MKGIEAPKCKLCGFQHWLNQPHVYAKRIDSVEDVEEVVPNARREPVSVSLDVIARGAPSAPTSTSVTKPVTKRGGRPKRYETPAARQRAYRERKV